ncbi:hypothetical protein WDW86_20610 [Bdellovibrionota bacterium FG-2]
MKIIVQGKGSITILTITEAIGREHVTALKAGLQKLIKAGKQNILLNMTGSTPTDFASLDVMSEINSLAAWAYDQNAAVVVTSPINEIAQFPSLQEGITALNSPNMRSILAEMALQSQVRALEAKKAALGKKYNDLTTSKDTLDITTLLKENTVARKLVRSLEEQVVKLLKHRTKPGLSPNAAAKMRAVEKTAVTVLEQEGVLKVRA